MKTLIICGVFAKENEYEIVEHARRPVEYSANVFQEKLIRGFEGIDTEVSVISAPFIGSYPNASNIKYFTGFEEKQVKYEYVPFNNLWGVRNFSRAASLKKAVNDFAKDADPCKLIVVYSPHTPFLEAAVYAKKKDPKIKICLVVPDLPQFMNLNAKVSIIYKIGKWFDIKKFNRLNSHVDSYVLLTEQMSTKINISGKPYCVIEGIAAMDAFEENERKRANLSVEADNLKYIVYTGKMNEKFGVIKLVDEFSSTNNDFYRLVLCGSGDADNYIAQKASTDARIMRLGQVTHDEALSWMLRADVLVNPRENNEEYTKYSFPSKIIEYLATGNLTVSYMLDGMPDIYGSLLFTADSKGLMQTIKRALNTTEEEQMAHRTKARTYLKKLSAESVAESIINTTLYGVLE